MMIHPGQQEDRQRVIARLEDDEQLSASGGWHEKGIAGESKPETHYPRSTSRRSTPGQPPLRLEP
eukprot:scaffold14883_cov39-Phaeocystis_antarctica.AAC.1